ncbi:HAD-IC family P-type ATPase [Candidatus Saccharibacteria bacterium]|nr:HAD-IC family P-type ATPase [Candidatus Saccharibacteria bacterium]
MEGLTNKQIEAKIKQGKVNQSTHKNRNTISKIIFKNTFTIFNLVNLILAVLIISVGSYKNLLFVFIAIANTLISIINEVRAKRIVDKLRLVSEQQPTVIREGKTIQIPADELVEGDLLILSLGDQILVDSEVKEGEVEVNESFITGEQDNIKKQKGDKLISGSFIVSGTCKAEAIAVGTKSQLNKIETTAHSIKTTNSKLFTLMNNIVKYISFALIPIGALVLWSRFRINDGNTTIAITSTVASLINMIPEGLVLLTSTVLALATIRLSKKQVLVQDLYSIETLARTDCIALDKTGTLTTGRMKLKDLVPAKSYTKDALINALKLILSTDTAGNATSTALKEKLLKDTEYEPTEQINEIIPFSSDRKYSGIVTNKNTYLMGAPEFITKEKPNFSDEYRILAVTKNNKLLGYALLEDELRPNAKNIINYFYKNDIAVKIISGDNLRTVQKIAKQTGVKDYERATDLSTLKNPDYDQLVKDYTIFTRVKPNEKKNLIRALKKQGNTVAMTGDGVNDILAMKEADVSIAIGDGSDAARRSAKIVLLNSGYESVPSIMDEGRQSINNLERSTALFLAKTVYASILAVIFIFIPIQYPFSSPVEMSLLNFACIGFPGLILALEHNTARIKNRFIRNIIEYSVPVGFTISVSMLVISLLAHFGVFPSTDLSTIAIFVTFATDLALIYWISKPLNPLRSSLLLAIIGIIAGAFLIPFTHRFFDFVFLSPTGLIAALIAIVSSLVFYEILRRIMKLVSSRIFDQNDI